MNIDEMIAQYKIHIESLAQAQKRVVELEKTIRAEVAKCPYPKPRYSPSNITEDKFGIVRIETILVNPNEEKNHPYPEWSPNINKEKWDIKRTSLGYHYANGYIHSDHGGWHLLTEKENGEYRSTWNNHIAVTPEEWDAIKRGNISERLRPEWLVLSKDPVPFQKK